MTDTQTYIVIGFLGIITILVLVQAYRSSPAYAKKIGYNIVSNFREAITELDTATKAHVQANAVLALLDQFQDRPEIVENLANYSQQMVAAAITQRINSTVADIAVVSEKLSYHRKKLAGCHAVDLRSVYQREVNFTETMLERLQRQLEVLHSLSQNFDLLRSSVDE